MGISIDGKRFETKELAQYRRELLSNVSGEILELGIGTGVNLPYYPKYVNHITGVDQKVRKLRSEHPVTEHYYSEYSALPFEDDSFDTIVVTFVFCRIVDIEPVIAELKRVLRPRGRLLFLEQGQSNHEGKAICQDLINPLWEILGRRVINRNYFEWLKEKDFLLAHQKLEEVTIPPKTFFGTIYLGIGVNVK